MKEREVQSFLPKIKVIQQSARPSHFVQLRVKLRDGRVLKKEGDRSPGIIAWEDLAAKYRDCLEGILPPDQIEQSFQMIQELEKIKKISEIIKTLIPDKAKHDKAKH